MEYAWVVFEGMGIGIIIRLMRTVRGICNW